MALTLDDVFASPDHYLHSFDDDDRAVFVPMDRAAYGRSIFLDGRIEPARNGHMALPLTSLPVPPAPAPTAWIFHIAHCGSTLLARALDDARASLVLREPLALRQCAFRSGGVRLALTAAMLSKRYRADAPTLVKANVPVNFLLRDLAGLQPAARAILLYLPLRDYCLAILRSDDHRRWLRNVTAQLASHLGDVSALTDAARAATLWQAQMAAFADALERWPGARTLDAESFFARPRAVLGGAASHLGLPLDDEMLDAAVAGPLFSTYSKNPRVAFDNDARLARRATAERAMGPEIAAAESWIAAQPAAPGQAVAAAALAL